MLARLGNVLFVAGLLVAVLFLAVLVFIRSDGGSSDTLGQVVLVVLAALAAATGWAARYVLAGR